jgi:hypothetical protein
MYEFLVRTSCSPIDIRSRIVDLLNANRAALDDLTPKGDGSWVARVVVAPVDVSAVEQALGMLPLIRSTQSVTNVVQDGRVQHLLGSKLEVRRAEVTLLSDRP